MIQRGNYFYFLFTFVHLQQSIYILTVSFFNCRVTIAFFAVCGLDILNSLDLLTDEKRKEIINWVYRHQVIPKESSELKCGGFQGSSTINISNSDENCGSEKYKWGHLAMTYTGIAILVTLCDDLSRLDRKAIIEGVAAVQRPDGSFSASVEGNEHDMRFVYCAAAICFMLNDWGTVDKKRMAQYIEESIVSFIYSSVLLCDIAILYMFCVLQFLCIVHCCSAMITVLVSTTKWNHMVGQHFVPSLHYN